MERDDLSLRKEFVQGAEALRAFLFGPGRVAAQDLEAQLPARALDLPADMAHTHDAQLRVLQRNLLPRRHPVQGGEHVVHHAAGIASGRVIDLDPMLLAPRNIDMVRADGSGGNHLHVRPLQQLRIAARTGPGNQYIGIQAILPGDIRAVLVDDLGVRLKHSLKKGNESIGDNLHFVVFLYHTNIMNIRIRCTNFYGSMTFLQKKRRKVCKSKKSTYLCNPKRETGY